MVAAVSSFYLTRNLKVIVHLKSACVIGDETSFVPPCSTNLSFLQYSLSGVGDEGYSVGKRNEMKISCHCCSYDFQELQVSFCLSVYIYKGTPTFASWFPWLFVIVLHGKA